MKYDGYRLLVAVGGGEARAYTRSGLDWSEKFDAIVQAAAKLNVGSALLAGEAVVLDGDGRSTFQALRGALKGAPATIDYYAFDLLELNGEDLTGLPLTDRKGKLREILPDGDPRIRYSEHIVGNGEKMLHKFCDAGLERVISKLANAKYVGSRAGSRVKTKCIKRQEFIIVGWTPSEKSRSFRSLILGVHDKGELRYAGKVGTGFNTEEVFRPMEIMQPIEQAATTVKAPRAEVRGGHWLKPRLVAEIAYTEMTNEGTLRHPSYLGLREDKNLVFDLDPDVGLDFEAVRSAAFHFREILQQIGLETFPMVTGGKGIHLIAPLVPKAEWPEVKDFAHRLAQAVAQSDPEDFTAALPKAHRKGRIFVDYLRNQRGATAVMPYSARARSGAPVAAPITWKEMETIDTPAHWHIGDAAELVKRAASKALAGWGRADQVLSDL